MFATFWWTVKTRLRAVAVEERGDVVNWLIVTLGVAIASAAVIVVLRPSIESAGRQIAGLLGG
jgi:hypothetical protein